MNIIIFVIFFGVTGYLFYLKKKEKFIFKKKKKYQPDKLQGLKDGIQFINHISILLSAAQHQQRAFALATQSLNPGQFKEDCLRIVTLYSLGRSFSGALEDGMRSSSEPAAARIFETIRISTKYGSRLVDDLELISNHFQAEVNSIIEEVVAKAPIKMIFPLVIFIFPVLFILLAGSSFQEFISILN